MALTNVACRTAKPQDKQYTLKDGGSLYLYIKPTGSKLWIYRYRLNNQANMYSIGSYPEVSLLEAREHMKKAKLQVKKGMSPTRARDIEIRLNEKNLSDTLESIANEWINKRENERSPTYHKQVKKMLEDNVYPEIGKLPIRQISSTDILDVLEKTVKRGAPSVAQLLKQWLDAIFRFAGSTSRVDNNPVSMLRGAISRPKPTHHRPLNKHQISRLAKVLESYPGNRETVIAIKLLMLTFVRTGELRKAIWSEIDLVGAQWKIPAERMKKGRPHIVPLSNQAIELLLELKQLTGNREHLFPNVRKPTQCMSSTTINRALEKLEFAGKNGVGFSAHGFRATASTMLYEHQYPSEVIEIQLAHIETNQTKAAYNQAEYLPKRREMMQFWADEIDKYALTQSPS
jgi:integrase